MLNKKQTPPKLEELIEEGKSFFEKIKGFRFDSYDSDILREEPWLRLKGKIKEYEFEAFIKKVYEAGGEAERNRAIKALTVDMTEMRFTDDKWKKRWEVFEDRGVDPCIECSNSDNIKDYLKNQHETK